MSFGASSFGSTSFSGSANSANEQVFFVLDFRAPDTLFEASALFNGTEEFYEILTQQGAEPGSGPMGIQYEIFTSHGEGETPISQVKVSGNGQSIIGAAPIIIVTAIIDSDVWPSGLNFRVRGRPYTQ